MPQGHWERAFWAAARSGDFTPYPPEHWKKAVKKAAKKKKKSKNGYTIAAKNGRGGYNVILQAEKHEIKEKSRKQPKDAIFGDQGAQLSFFI